jgi:hypothetical protein
MTARAKPDEIGSRPWPGSGGVEALKGRNKFQIEVVTLRTIRYLKLEYMSPFQGF